MTAEAFIAQVGRAAARLDALGMHALADAVESAGDSPGAVRAAVLALPQSVLRDTGAEIVKAWSSSGASGEVLAVALRSAAVTAARVRAEQTIAVAWTGPTSEHVPVRRTDAVLQEVIGGSIHQLTIVSFAAYKVAAVLDALGAAAQRGVDVRLVLESEAESQGGLSYDAAEAFRALNGIARFFSWPLDQRETENGNPGRMHAKCAIADGERAFVTSANLTGFALAINMELGLLVDGGPVPRRLQAHFDALIASGVLRPV